MIMPVRNGNVPASTPAVDQPMPLSMLETITAAPKVPVRAAVTNYRARPEIIDADASIDEPSLLGGDVPHVLDVLVHELVKFRSVQQSVGLRGALDVFLPLRRGLHLPHQLNVKGHLVRRDLAGEPDRARLLELRNVQARFDAGGNVVPALRCGDVRTFRQLLR